MKSKKQGSNRYRIYVPLTGGVMLAAEELERGDGVVRLKDAAHVQPAPNGAGYVFTPIMFVDTPMLYLSGLLLEDTMPLPMVPYFEKHRARCEEARRSQP